MKQFTRIPNSLFTSKVWQTPRTFSTAEAYIDLLRRAIYRSSKVKIAGDIITLEPRQLICTADSLSKAWQQPKESVIDFLNRLEALGAISRTSYDTVTVVTVDFNFIFAQQTQKRPL